MLIQLLEKVVSRLTTQLEKFLYDVRRWPALHTAVSNRLAFSGCPQFPMKMSHHLHQKLLSPGSSSCAVCYCCLLLAVHRARTVRLMYCCLGDSYVLPHSVTHSVITQHDRVAKSRHLLLNVPSATRSYRLSQKLARVVANCSRSCVTCNPFELIAYGAHMHVRCILLTLLRQIKTSNP